MNNTEITETETGFQELQAHNAQLIPFIGAGFSRPACPGWAEFMLDFYEHVRNDFMPFAAQQQFEALARADADNKFEQLADLLAQYAERRRFAEELQRQFDRSLQPQMQRKFQLLHDAFPGLKITTNFDCLVENNCRNGDVNVCPGYETDNLNRLLAQRDRNSLLKIHGCMLDMPSVVLTTKQYAGLYQHPHSFDPAAPLPDFLNQLFSNYSVLFIGCSLSYDRALMVLQQVDYPRPHFALLKRPPESAAYKRLQQRLSRLFIKPLWIDDFSEIETVLATLAPAALKIQPEPNRLDHNIQFVGREPQLAQIKQQIEQQPGAVEVISGKLFNLHGAGGMGKTTLAYEIALQYQDGDFMQCIRRGAS